MVGILLNENLPPSLIDLMAPHFGTVRHVGSCALGGADDDQVWEYAVANGLAVMTKDSDYLDLMMSQPEGRVILVASGNLRLRDLKAMIAARTREVAEFLESKDRLMVLGHAG